MKESENSKQIKFFETKPDQKICVLDGRSKTICFDRSFSIVGDDRRHSFDFSWIPFNSVWGELMLDVLVQLIRTHSLSNASQTAFVAKKFYEESELPADRAISLKEIAKVPEVMPIVYWGYLQPLLRRMAANDNEEALTNELKKFLQQPSNWETKGKGEYFALVANDPLHGAFTLQELMSIQDGVNLAYEQRRISLYDYSLVWFMIGTGVRPIQIARMKAGDVKIYNGPEGKEVTLYIPLAKKMASPDQGKWRRRCPTILAEILIEYLKFSDLKEDQPLFKDRSDKIRYSLQRIFQKVETYSNRTDTAIRISPYRFRYTLGTRAIALGGSDAEVARLLTHSRTGSIRNYRASMPEIQKPIWDALSGEMSIIANVFSGKLIKDIGDATRSDQMDAIIRDYLHLNGEAIGACGTEAKCYQHAPRACLTCRKFEPFLDAPWEELICELEADMNSEDEDKMKLITLPLIQAAKVINDRCEEHRITKAK